MQVEWNEEGEKKKLCELNAKTKLYYSSQLNDYLIFFSLTTLESINTGEMVDRRCLVVIIYSLG